MSQELAFYLLGGVFTAGIFNIGSRRVKLTTVKKLGYIACFTAWPVILLLMLGLYIKRRLRDEL